MTKRIYLDNAASSPMDPEVFEEMKPFFLEHFGNPSSIHQNGRFLRNAIEQARRKISQILHVSPSEIYFTSGGTEADNLAITGAVKGYGITHIVSTSIEHHAVTHTVERLEREGIVTVTWLDVDSKGNIDLAQLRNVLSQNLRSLVSLMHANNEIGTLYDIKAIGEICKEFDALFHSDTVQSIGKEEIDLSQIHVHFINASAHKFYGPKGTGFIFVRKGTKIPALIEGGSQERNLRAGTENPASITGMAFALEKCYHNLEEKTRRMWDLKNYMMQRLQAEVPGVLFNGETERGKSICTVLNTVFPFGEEDAMLLFNLDLAGIAVSGGSACNSGANMGSHVLRGIGASKEALINSVRFSFGMENTREEIDYVVEKLKELAPTQIVR
ncbi:MAG: cysteine desulfurase family protein [Bacteroidia bacterium]